MRNSILGLSSNQLKIIAVITMTIDHIGLYLFPGNLVLRMIGRIAFPIFAFTFAEGCKYTKNRTARREAIFRKRNSKFCSPAKHGRHASMNTKLAGRGLRSSCVNDAPPNIIFLTKKFPQISSTIHRLFCEILLQKNLLCDIIYYKYGYLSQFC